LITARKWEPIFSEERMIPHSHPGGGAVLKKNVEGSLWDTTFFCGLLRRMEGIEPV